MFKFKKNEFTLWVMDTRMLTLFEKWFNVQNLRPKYRI